MHSDEESDIDLTLKLYLLVILIHYQQIMSANQGHAFSHVGENVNGLA